MEEESRMLDAENRKLAKRNKQLERDLLLLTKSICALISLIDAELSKTSTPERGKIIAGWLNSIEMQNDHVRHFTLGINLKTGRRERKKAQ